jgi:Na+-translocating ferredoxin:NAD+ oxidoreductase RnfC subunit
MTDIKMESANSAFLRDPSNLLNVTSQKQRKSKEKSCERHRRMKQRCPVECPGKKLIFSEFSKPQIVQKN